MKIDMRMNGRMSVGKDREKLKENTRGFDGSIPSLAKEKRHTNKKERQAVRRGLMMGRYEED
jgi:hypothetical protein